MKKIHKNISLVHKLASCFSLFLWTMHGAQVKQVLSKSSIDDSEFTIVKINDTTDSDMDTSDSTSIRGIGSTIGDGKAPSQAARSSGNSEKKKRKKKIKKSNSKRRKKDDLKSITAWMSEFSKRVDVLQDSNNKQNIKIVTLNNEVTKLKNDNQNLNNEVIRLKDDNQNLNNEVIRLKDDNQNLNSEVTKLKNDNQNLNNEVIRLKDENQKQVTKITNLNSQITKLKDDSEKQATKILNLNNEVTRLKSENGNLTKEVNDIKKENRILRKKVKKIEKQKKNLSKRLSELEEEKNKINRLLTEQKKKNKKLEERLNEIEKEKEEMVKLVKKYEEEKDSYKKEIKKLKADNKTLRTMFEGLLKRKDEKMLLDKKRIEELEAQVRGATGNNIDIAAARPITNEERSSMSIFNENHSIFNEEAYRPVQLSNEVEYVNNFDTDGGFSVDRDSPKKPTSLKVKILRAGFGVVIIVGCCFIAALVRGRKKNNQYAT